MGGWAPAGWEAELPLPPNFNFRRRTAWAGGGATLQEIPCALKEQPLVDESALLRWAACRPPPLFSHAEVSGGK